MPTFPPLSTDDVWLGRDMALRDDWRRVLGDGEVEELMAARATARARSTDRTAWNRQDFPLPRLRVEVAAWLEALDRGRGFLLLRGLPVAEIGKTAFPGDKEVLEAVNALPPGLKDNLKDTIGADFTALRPIPAGKLRRPL